MRRLYGALLRLHPKPFRERFSDEMIEIFEEEARKHKPFGLLLDAAVSVLRQHVLRPSRQQPAVHRVGTAAPVPAAAALFQSIDVPPIRPSAFASGIALALLSLAALGFASARGGAKAYQLLIGAKHPRTSLLSVDRASITETEPTTELKVRTPDVDPLAELADAYFTNIRVLAALDANNDRTISAWEMLTARSPLRRLDLNQDGELSPEECGFSLRVPADSAFGPSFVSQARLDFMKMNPVLSTLDVDGSGRISAHEIEGAAVALRTLDRNRDGNLTPTEVLPELVHARTALVFAILDTNRDRLLSHQERDLARDEKLKSLLDTADRDRNGVLSWTEVKNELQIREEANRQLNRAKSRVNRAR